MANKPIHKKKWDKKYPRTIMMTFWHIQVLKAHLEVSLDCVYLFSSQSAFAWQMMEFSVWDQHVRLHWVQNIFVSSIGFTFFSILPLPFFCNLSHYRALLLPHLMWASWLRIRSIEKSGCWEDSNERGNFGVFNVFGTAGPAAFIHPTNLTA